MAQRYQDLQEAVISAIRSARGPEEAIQKAVDLLHDRLEHFNWTGVYLLDGDHLKVFYYRGNPTPHEVIPVNQGICGAAVREKATLNIGDVNKDPRYLACSLETRSELVVPIMRGDEIWGEIDIDSHQLAAFSQDDEELLQRIAEALADKFLAAGWKGKKA
jgi:GAF domain-containing protein